MLLMLPHQMDAIVGQDSHPSADLSSSTEIPDLLGPATDVLRWHFDQSNQRGIAIEGDAKAPMDFVKAQSRLCSRFPWLEILLVQEKIKSNTMSSRFSSRNVEFLFSLAIIFVEHGKNRAPILAAGRKILTLLSSIQLVLGKEAQPPENFIATNRTAHGSDSIAHNLATRFLSLYSAGMHHRAHSILSACLDCGINKLQSEEEFLDCASCLYAIPGFVATLVKSLLDIGTRRPAARLLEMLISIFILLGKNDGIASWSQTIVETVLVNEYSPRKCDDLAIHMSHILKRVVQGMGKRSMPWVKKEAMSEAQILLRLDYLRTIWWEFLGCGMLHWSKQNPGSDNDERSRVLSCLRLCTSLDPSLSLGKLLSVENHSTSSNKAVIDAKGSVRTKETNLGHAGLAVMSALSEKKSGSILSRLQGLELCCDWISMAQDPGDLRRTAEVWSLQCSGVLTSIFIGQDKDGNYVQRIKSCISKLILMCPPLRPAIATSIIHGLNSSASLRYGRLLLTLASICCSVTDEPAIYEQIRESIFNVLKSNEWAEVRKLAADTLGRMKVSPAYIALLLNDSSVELSTFYGKRVAVASRSSCLALIISLQYRASCGEGGMFRPERNGLDALLESTKGSLLPTGEANSAFAVNNHIGTMEAVAILLALPRECLLPKASNLMIACCSMIEEFAPKLHSASNQDSSSMTDVDAEIQKSEASWTPDYQDRKWILIRECCELLHKLLRVNSHQDKTSKKSKKKSTSKTSYKNRNISEAGVNPVDCIPDKLLGKVGRTLIHTAKRTDHHGAMQRMSSVLETVSKVLMKRHTELKGKNALSTVLGWLSELVSRVQNMHELARIRFSHDLPPCIISILRGLLSSLQRKATVPRKRRTPSMVAKKKGKKRKTELAEPPSVQIEARQNEDGGEDPKLIISQTIVEDSANTCDHNNRNQSVELELHRICVQPLLQLAADTSAHVAARIAAFHVLIRLFGTNNLRSFALRNYSLMEAVELAIGCCESGPYALSSAAALFWSVVIDLMTSCGGQQKCSPVTLFLHHPDLLRVIRPHALRATKSVILDSSSSCNAPIKTGLSAPLVLLSLCTQLCPAANADSDPRQLHNYVCRDLRSLAEALLASPQMLLRQLAAKALARLVHPADIKQELEKITSVLRMDLILQREDGKHKHSLNKCHGYLLKLEQLLLHHGVICKMDRVVTAGVLEHLQTLNDTRGHMVKCSCTVQVLGRLIHHVSVLLTEPH